MRANSSSAAVHAVARIDDEQREIGSGQGRFRLLAHAIGDGAPLSVLEARRVEKRDGVTADSASPSRRSRVSPGRSETSASRVPVRRLKSVDLPTLGRPTIAILETWPVSGLRPLMPRIDRKSKGRCSPRPARAQECSVLD